MDEKELKDYRKDTWYVSLLFIFTIILLCSMAVNAAQPPVFDKLLVSDVDITTAVIHIHLDAASNYTLEYTNSSSNFTDELFYSTDPAYQLIWNVPLASLNNNTQYWFNVTACRASGECSESDVHTFYTDIDHTTTADEDSNFWGLALVVLILGLAGGLLYTASILNEEHALLQTFFIMTAMGLLLTGVHLVKVVVETTANIGVGDLADLATVIDSIYLIVSIVLYIPLFYFMVIFLYKMSVYVTSLRGINKR